MTATENVSERILEYVDSSIHTLGLDDAIATLEAVAEGIDARLEGLRDDKRQLQGGPHAPE